jgi:hypothetical protein
MVVLYKWWLMWRGFFLWCISCCVWKGDWLTKFWTMDIASSNDHSPKLHFWSWSHLPLVISQFTIFLLHSPCFSDWLLCDWIHTVSIQRIFLPDSHVYVANVKNCSHISFLLASITRIVPHIIFYSIIIVIIHSMIWLSNKGTAKRMYDKYDDLNIS